MFTVVAVFAEGELEPRETLTAAVAAASKLTVPVAELPPKTDAGEILTLLIACAEAAVTNAETAVKHNKTRETNAIATTKTIPTASRVARETCLLLIRQKIFGSS